MGTNAKLTIKQRLENFKAMEKEDKRRWWGEFFIDNSLYIFLIAAIIGIAVYNPNFVSMKSIINIVSLSAANLPIALGIAGAIILTGTDLSAGRVVGPVSYTHLDVYKRQVLLYQAGAAKSTKAENLCRTFCLPPKETARFNWCFPEPASQRDWRTARSLVFMRASGTANNLSLIHI